MTNTEKKTVKKQEQIDRKKNIAFLNRIGITDKKGLPLKSFFCVSNLE